jgi:hypothetical protein
VAGVHRADRRHRRPHLERREVRDDELRAVEEIERDAVALLHVELGERAGEAVRGLPQLAIADLPTVEDDRRLFGRPVGRFVEHLRDRLERRVDGLRHPWLVMLEPGPGEVLGAGVHRLLPAPILEGTRGMLAVDPPWDSPRSGTAASGERSTPHCATTLVGSSSKIAATPFTKRTHSR